MTAAPAPAAPPEPERDSDDPDAPIDDKAYQRDPRRRFRHFMRRWVKRPLLRLILRIIPPIYLAYCWLVWRTSRIEDGMQPFHDISRAHDGVVGLLWHEEVFTVAWAYQDFAPHTLASVGDAGEAITRLLERCNFTVFRGGSARKRSRRIDVLPAMIEHMKANRQVIYGITVDGSVGPRFRLKKGSLVIARDCARPVAIVRTWARWRLRLPTWDRMAIPLPFNVIRRTMRGPYFVPPEASTPEGMEAFRKKMEQELAGLAAESYRGFRQRVPAALAKVLAEGQA